MKSQTIIAWIARLTAAVILLTSVYYKFSGYPETVGLLKDMGMDPAGRIWTGIAELVVSLLILYPRTTGYGALFGLFIMGVAIYFHLTKLGIAYRGTMDPFNCALIVFTCCLLLVYLFHKDMALPPAVGMG